jgi:hypothetical protein
MDDLGHAKPIDRFSQRIVVGIAGLATEGSMPAFAKRLEYRMDTYRTPQCE